MQGNTTPLSIPHRPNNKEERAPDRTAFTQRNQRFARFRKSTKRKMRRKSPLTPLYVSARAAPTQAEDAQHQQNGPYGNAGVALRDPAGDDRVRTAVAAEGASGLRLGEHLCRPGLESSSAQHPPDELETRRLVNSV